jgi:oligopeptidase A
MMAQQTDNPLLDFSGLPRFADFRADWVTPAIDILLTENRALIKRLCAAPDATGWDGFVQPLEDANERLRRAWGQIAHLNAVMNTAQLREAYNGNLARVTKYHAELMQHDGLHRRYLALRASSDYLALSTEQRKVVENTLRDFRLGGADLPEPARSQFRAITEELAQLSANFSDNLLDATNAFKLLIEDRARLSGIPDDVIHTARQAAQKENQSGWQLTLHAPCYLPVMQFADQRELREQVYRAYVTRAAEFSEQWDNTPLIARIVRLRRQQANLLGFPHFAALSLEPKMARSVEQVMEFLKDLARRAMPFARRDLEELAVFARERLGLQTLQAWDIPYAAEKMRSARFDFSDQEVKQYFPQPHVLAGMFRVVEQLYGLNIVRTRASVWHDDVMFFDLLSSDHELIGQFYLDLYARPSKRGGAWMDDAVSRRRTSGGIQRPVAYLNCNFSGPVGGKPALFTHDEVITLFHEFGHGLHHLLTEAVELGVSGINGVEWDAVELPSQFMENFCWDWQVLCDMTQHIESGERLPRELFDRLLAAKNFHSGLQTLRQVEFALFDLHLHFDFDPDGGRTPLQMLDDIRRRVAVILPPEYNRFPNSFSHIFAGGYAAGYYSYKWAEVLAADAFSAFTESGAFDRTVATRFLDQVLSADAYSVFEENSLNRDDRSVLDASIGLRFRSEILAMGGIRPALESFVQFRGREPRIDALLVHHGMA